MFLLRLNLLNLLYGSGRKWACGGASYADDSSTQVCYLSVRTDDSSIGRARDCSNAILSYFFGSHKSP